MSLAAAERKFFAEHPGVPFDEGAYRREERAPVEFAVESWSGALPEMRRLFDDHWQEIALNKDAIPLDIDYELYARLERDHELHLVTARDDGWLVGYHLSVIRPHPHYRSTLHCMTDVFYLRPAYRSGMTGYKLLKAARDSVQARGVKKMLMGTKMAIDIDPLLKRLGFTPIERVYSVVFK